MNQTNACVSSDLLRLFLQGKLDDAQADGVVRHLEECSQCLARVQALEKDDSFFQAAARGTPDAGDPAATDQRVLDVMATMDSASDANRTTAVDAGLEQARAEFSTFLAPPQGPDELGRLGSYRLLRPIGKGGMGMVFLAEDTVLRRPVALKVMHPQLGSTAIARERFLREARAGAAIRHDHVITIHQAGEQGGVAYLAMELLEGETLAERLAKGKPTLAENLRIAREMAAGLAAAHAKGLIHRDVKPANVWLEARGEGGASPSSNTPGPFSRVKILDFGLVRATEGGDAVTGTGQVMGTPAYMAPEQARGETVDARADLFSLGCVLYEMTTGKRPFEGKTSMAVLRSLEMDEPKPPEVLNPETPRSLSQLIQRLLIKDAARRNTTAQQVAAELAAMEAASAAATSSSVTQHEPAPRGPWLLRLAVAAALLGAVVLGAVIVMRLQTREGTLIVESDDPDAEIVVKGKQVTILQGKKRYEINLRPGDFTVEVKGKEGLKLSTKEFTIENGGRKDIHVRWEPLIVEEPKKTPEGKKKTPEDEPTEWTSLFNGKDLSGWKAVLKDGAPDDSPFKVQDGILVIRGKPLGYLHTTKSYRNYAVRYDWKFAAAAAGEKPNSGLLVHIQEPHKVWPSCYEIQGQQENAGFIFGVGLGPAGGEFKLDKESQLKAIRPFEWNTTEVTCQDGEIVCRINGVVVCSGKALLLSEGPIGFQSEHSEVHIKNAQIKELSTGAIAKHTIKEVMLRAMKPLLPRKVMDGKASQEEKKELVELFASLHASVPPKGDIKDWRLRTGPILKAAEDALHGKDASALKLINCAACHKAHKVESAVPPEKEAEPAPGPPKHTIKEVMLKVMKTLPRKVMNGEATPEEKKELVEMFASLHASKPPKGAILDWQAHTGPMLKTAEAALRGEDASAFKTQINCSVCHKAHKAEESKGAVSGKDEPKKVTADPAWHDITPGKELAGWKQFKSDRGLWQVEGGVVTRVLNSGPTILFSEDDTYANFHLKMDFKVEEGSRAGLLFRSEFFAPKFDWAPTDASAPRHGYLLELNGDSTYKKRSGRIIGLGPVLPGTDKTYVPETWASLELIADGNRFVVRVDGTKTLDTTDAKNLYKQGHLALAIVTPKSILQVRKIEVKRLPPG